MLRNCTQDSLIRSMTGEANTMDSKVKLGRMLLPMPMTEGVELSIAESFLKKEGMAKETGVTCRTKSQENYTLLGSMSQRPN